MAILKHIASKNADYSEVQRYLLFEHDEYTGKPILDENGCMIPRKEYYVDGINCDPFSFDVECRELNAKYHKNQDYDEIKSHHYILSFDPKDAAERGLTGERAQQLGLEFAKKNLPGHQAFVCTHTDGHNESGNIWTKLAWSGTLSSSTVCGNLMWSGKTLWSVPVIPVPGSSTTRRKII